MPKYMFTIHLKDKRYLDNLIFKRHRMIFNKFIATLHNVSDIILVLNSTENVIKFLNPESSPTAWKEFLASPPIMNLD